MQEAAGDDRSSGLPAEQPPAAQASTSAQATSTAPIPTDSAANRASTDKTPMTAMKAAATR